MAKSDKEIILELTIRKENLEKGIVKLENTIKKAKAANEDYSMSLNKVELAEIKLATTSAKLEKAQKGLANTVIASSKKMKQVKDATGSATAATMELSRVVSDAPYGIRGMANNITQLVSQLGTATDNAGGFRKAIGLMIKQLTGPLGVVFAITAAVAALDYFYGANKKVKEETSKLNEVFGEESTKLMVLKSALDDSNISLESKQELVKAANSEFEDLNVTLDESGRITKETAENIDLLSLSFIKNAKARAIASLIQEEMVKQAKIEAAEVGSNLKWYEEAYYAVKSNILGASADLAGAVERDSNNQKDAIKESADAVQRYIDLLKKGDAELAKKLFKPKKTKTTKKTTTDKSRNLGDIDLEAFEKDSKDLLSAQQNVNKQIELALAKSEEEKLEIQHKYRIISLNQAKATEIEKQKNALAIYQEKVEKEYAKEEEKNEKLLRDGKITDKQLTDWKIKASQKVIDSLEASDKESEKNIGKIIENYEPLIDLYEKLYGVRLDAIGAGDEEKKEKEFDAISHYVETYKKLMSGITNFTNGEYERQLTIEQNKTNLLNAELNNRLNNENLSKEQRKSIQDQILNNDEKLRVKQDIIAKKKFNTAKAFNIAMAVVDTYGAANKVLNDPALTGQPWARGIMAAATIASGLANVAAISRQKFQSSSANTPINTGAGGGADSGVGDRSFNFNLVGASQQNQLLNAIQSKFETPLKAFVVSKDITTQQELDVNIKGTATL
jgi:hypothetical protein